MFAADIMTRGMVTVTPETPLVAAIALMVDNRISGLPVLDAQERLVGIFTEGDLLHRVETGTGTRHRSGFMELLLGPGRLAKDYVTTHSRRVGDLMTGEVVTVDPQTPLEDVVALMDHRHIRRVPVVEAGKLVGIVSRRDLVRAVGHQLEAQANPPGSDDAIQTSVEQALANQKWVAASDISISVEDGVVTLSGVIFDERYRKALQVAAENVPGVSGVRDRLSWADPNSGIYLPAE
jgi:CBS domain-containing protein